MSSHSSVTIYLVEDSGMIRDRLQRMFKQEKNLQVVGWSASASKAIEDLKSLGPNVVVIDISLEEGDGFQVLDEVKRLQPKPLIIVCTNYAYLEFKARALAQGAQFFFDKSTEFEQILQAIHREFPELQD